MSVQPQQTPFADAVAERSAAPIEAVTELLAAKNIVANAVVMPTRALSVVSVAFSGKKTIDGAVQPFDFSWDTDGTGLRALVSVDNHAGKSTILQVILWALRGRIKTLTATSQQWIERVKVTFEVAGYLVTPEFENGEDVVGAVTIVRPDLTSEERPFEDAAQFERVMDEIMMGLLGFERLPATQERNDRVVSYNDGWLAYTSAFLTDSASNAIIGEAAPGLLPRIVQVFVGTPWVTTLLHAHAQAAIARNEEAQRTRKMVALGGQSMAELEAALAQIKAAIERAADKDEASRRLADAQGRFDEIARLLERSTADLVHLEAIEQAADGAFTRATTYLNSLLEEEASSAFFGLLKPTCCPRCSSPIPKQAYEAEATSHACSVCTRTVAQPDLDEFKIERAQAESRLDEARKALQDAKGNRKALGRKHATLRTDYEAAGRELARQAQLGTEADVFVLDRQRERLEGKLEFARALAQNPSTSSDELKILTAAEVEAEARVKAGATAVFEAISREILTLARDLGISDLESVVLKRNGNVDLRKGGGDTTFTKLSPGERLRLRLAALIALVKGGNGMQAMRHPGLLIIDAPGAEEMTRDDLTHTLEQLKTLSAAVPGLQIFVAVASEYADPFGTSSHVLRAKKGERLW